MRKKIRLALDFGIQLLLMIMLLVQSINNPSNIIIYATWFIFFISFWQIVYAFYLVQRHADWYRRIYLKNMSIVVRVFAAIILVGSSILFFTKYQILDALYFFSFLMIPTLGILIMQYFLRSIIDIYNYYNKPKSFWDL